MNGLRGREEVRKSYGINMGYTGRSFTKWSQVAAHTHWRNTDFFILCL